MQRKVSHTENPLIWRTKKMHVSKFRRTGSPLRDDIQHRIGYNSRVPAPGVSNVRFMHCLASCTFQTFSRTLVPHWNIRCIQTPVRISAIFGPMQSDSELYIGTGLEDKNMEWSALLILGRISTVIRSCAPVIMEKNYWLKICHPRGGFLRETTKSTAPSTLCVMLRVL